LLLLFCSGHSVVLTLWQQNATAAVLDGCEGRVLQVTAVRVGDFNGCSLSSGNRSLLTLDPETPGGHGYGAILAVKAQNRKTHSYIVKYLFWPIHAIGCELSPSDQYMCHVKS
jgi:hypothetical protein